MDSLEKLKQAIIAQVKANVPVQTVWAECLSADSSTGTMVATREGLEYDDVLLGLGADITVPEPGSKVLLGIIENKHVATFLLFAESIAERRINGNALGGIVKADAVAQELATLQAELNQLKSLLNAWVPVPNDGGAALKTSLTAWAGQPVATTNSQQLQNPKVSHG
ncbi:MAG: hypothetical protein KIT10_14610 [Flavobacteriales bacterium]|nr:hypothetical protein [Flavobacteriales bacterium]